MQHVKVTYIGLNNLFSRVTTLLLKQSPVVSKLILYGDQKFDCQDELTTGKSDCQIFPYCDRAQIFEALEGVDIVLIGDELVKPSNNSEHENTASKLYDYAKAIAQVSPEAFLVVAASPINVYMPFIAQLYGQLGCLNAGKLIGASTVDTVRANALLAAQLRMDPTSVVLPVVGGCSPLTRVPLISHAYPSSCISYISSENKKNIINKIRNNEKNKQDDAIEKAYATVRLIHSISAAITGPTQIPEIALVKNYSSLNVEYFALPLLIGKKGVEKVFTLKNITKTEERMVKTAIENMNLDVDKARDLLTMQSMENDDEELCNEEEDCVFVSDVNFKNEEPQKGQKRTSEKDFKSTKVEDMMPLHCPAEPYLETPSTTRQKSLEKKKTPLGWRLVPPYGIKKKNIGDFNDDSDFTNLPGINKYLRQEGKEDVRFEEIEETENHSMKASERSDNDKGNQYKFPDDMQTEFTLDNEADIENIKHNLRKSIEAIKTYNKAQKKNDNNKTIWDENLDDTTNLDVNEEHDIPSTNFKNNFTNVNEENNYLEESDAIPGEGDHQQESADCPNVPRQKGTDGNSISTTTKHPVGTLETPSMEAEYKILLVEPNVHEAETSEIPEDIQNYDIKYISEEALPKSKHVEELDRPSKPKLESKESYFQNPKTFSKFDIPLKGTDMPKTPSRAIKSENLGTYSLSTRNEESSLLNIYDSKLNMQEKFIPKFVKDVIKTDIDLNKRDKSESCYVMKMDKNNVVTQPSSSVYDKNKQNVVRVKESPASRLYDKNKQNVVRVRESPASRLYDKNKQNVVRAKESTNSNQDFERNDDQMNHVENVKVHSYSIFGQNIISLQPTDYLTERCAYKRQISKHGEDNSNAPNTTFTLNKNAQKKNKFQKENTSKLQNLNTNKYEIQIPETTKIQRNDYQKSRQLSQKSNSLSQSNAQSNNFQSISPKSKAFIPSNAQPIDSQKSKPFSPKYKSLTQSNEQSTDSQKSKPFSAKSKLQTQSSAQHTDTQKSKPFSSKSKSRTQYNAQPTDSQKSKPFSPKSKSLTQSNAQTTDSQKSKPFSPKSEPHTHGNAQPTDSQKSKPFSPKSKSRTQYNAQPTDSQKSKPFSPKSKSRTQYNAQPTDSQKSKPFSPKSKLHAESSSQLTDSEKSEPFSPKSKSLTQSSAQPTDTQKSKSFSPKSEPHTHGNAQPTDSQKSKPFSPKSESHTRGNAQPTDSQKSKPFSPKLKSHTQDNAQPTDAQKSKPFTPKSKLHAESSAQPTDSQKSNPLSLKSKPLSQSNAQPIDSQKFKPLSSKSKSFSQSNAQPIDSQKSKPLSSKSKSFSQSNALPIDSQKSKPLSSKSKSFSQSNAQPIDFQKSKPLSSKSKSFSQSTAQHIDSQKSKPVSPESQTFSQSNALLIDSRKSESHSQMSEPISQTEEIQSFGTQQSKSFAQTHDTEKTNSPTEINNVGSAASQKSKYNPNEQQESSISLNKFSESMLEENLKEIKKEPGNTATHMAVSPTCSFNTINHGVSNLINPKTYLSGSSLDQLRGIGNVEHADKLKDNSSSKKINGKHEMLKAKNLSQKTENNNSKSISSQVKRHEAANDFTESKLNKDVEYRISSKWAPSTSNGNRIGQLKKTATPSLNTENEKVKEIKQQGLKMERTNQEANMKADQSKVNYKINSKKDPTTNLQLIHQIKLEEKKLMLAQGTVNKEKQQLEKSKILQSGRKYKPVEKTGNIVDINASKVVKKFNKQTNSEQNVKAEKQQFSKVLNTEKTKFTDHNMGNRKSEKTQLNQCKDVKRKQKEVKSEAVYNKQENFQMAGKTHNLVHTRDNQNKTPWERTVDEQWTNTEFPQRKLTIKPIVPTKPKLTKNKSKVALNPVKISLSTSNRSKDYDVKLINRPLSARMNRSKFVFSDSKASLTTLTEYNRILLKNNALTKNAPIHPIKYSIKSIIEEEQNNKNMQLGRIAKMRPTFRENGIAINVESEDCKEKKVDQVNVKNNNADKKYKIWSPTEDGNQNKVDKIEKEKKTSGWGGRLFQLFKNVISKDLDDEQTRTQISTDCLKLKEKLPPVNDLRTKVFIANKISHNWKTNNERRLHGHYDNRMIDNLKINETNRSSLNKTSRKRLYTAAGGNNKSLSTKRTTLDDRVSSSINSQKMGNYNTATDESIRNRKKEVMAYFGKKVTYNHNQDADSMDNLSSRMMGCRPYRKPVRLMSRFKPLYNFDNSNDN